MEADVLSNRYSTQLKGYTVIIYDLGLSDILLLGMVGRAVI